MLRPIFAALPRFALFLLAMIPVLTGVVILLSMRDGSVNALSEPQDILRRQSYSFSMIGHIIGGSAMLILGFAQFSSRLRRNFPAWHRWSGRVLVALGVVFALTALRMNFSDQAMAGSALHDAAQNLAALAFLATLGLGVAEIRRGEVARHRVWMMRSYALALGAATQTVLLLPVFLILGSVEGLGYDLVFIAGWLVNLAVAEFLLRHRPMRRMLSTA